MKLIINYDFIDAVRNANDSYNIYKIARNSKKEWSYLVPFWTVIDYAIWKNIPDTITWLNIQLGIDILSRTLENKITGIDKYEIKACKNLKQLVSHFNDLNISTDYDLLLQSELYKKNYNIGLSDEKLPFLKEAKYIYVPCYKYDGDVEVTSIQQEHVIGSREYVLSLGSPKSSYKYSFSGI